MPLHDPGVAVLICNSNVPHALHDGEYARRRGDCEEAVRRLASASLRHATLEAVEAAQNALDPEVYRRARHVVTENARTVAAAAALATGDLAFRRAHVRQPPVAARRLRGQLPRARHAGRDRGEISEAGGVFGARMTGGGFGGCAVMLVRTRAHRVDHARRWRASTGGGRGGW